MESMLQDLRYGLRMMRRSPGLTLVAIVTLALGIGANSALFSVVNAVLLQPLPYPEADRLAILWGTTPDIPKEEASLPDYTDWKAQSQSFDGMAAVRFMNSNVSGEGEPERVIGARVTHDFLNVLGVQPALGRGFTAEEDRVGAERVVVLSNGLWQRRFGSDPNIVGKSVRISEDPYTVVGVMAPEFRLPTADAALFVPLAMDPAKTGRRNDAYLVVARLKPGVALASAQAEMTGIAGRLEEAYPETNAGWTILVIPMLEEVVGNYRLALYILFAAVGCVLLIACANVANLLLARATARNKELAIRAALGAGRWRLVRQLLLESTLLALLGGALGLLVAVWGKEALLAVSPVDIPRMSEAALDGQVLGFAFAVSVLTGVLFGLAPAMHAVRAAPQGTLKESGHGLVGDSRGRLRGFLVVSQLCLALILLVGMGLAIRSFSQVQRVDPGFDAGAALTARVALPAVRYGDAAKIVPFFARLKEQLAAQPGVQGVTFANALPIQGGGPFLSFDIEGAPPPPPGSVPDANIRVVDSDYFELMNVPLRAGRVPTAQDTDATPSVIVVNETFARQISPSESPIGKRIAFNASEDGNPIWREIVGIVGDVKHEGLDEKEVRGVYAPLAQAAGSANSYAIVVRTAGAPESLSPALRTALRTVDENLPLYSVRTMDEIVSRSMQTRRFGMLLLAFFGVVALVLAGVGIYSVMSYSVNQRTHEIGIRMALGAARRDVIGMIIRQGMSMALIGLVLGAMVALGAVSFAASLLFEVSPFDPIAFVAAGAVLGAISLAACLLPALRASGVDPMVALRHE
jgi:putative ABC transport system permease protein